MSRLGVLKVSSLTLVLITPVSCKGQKCLNFSKFPGLINITLATSGRQNQKYTEVESCRLTDDVVDLMWYVEQVSIREKPHLFLKGLVSSS